MPRITAERNIDAPIEKVFDVVAHIENFSKAVPHITNVEYLSDTQRGPGTRFRETRIMKGREATTELEVTEYVENQKVRMVSDAGGTVWDTMFRMRADGDGTKLGMVMDARPTSLVAKITTPLVKGMIGKAIEEDMDAIKAYCESE